MTQPLTRTSTIGSQRQAAPLADFTRESGTVTHCHQLTTKIKVYRAVVISTLIYGAETRTLYRRQVRLLECFHQQFLRSILNIKWHDYVFNEDVLEKAELPSVKSILLKQQLRWAGHVARMEDSRHAKVVFFGEL